MSAIPQGAPAHTRDRARHSMMVYMTLIYPVFLAVAVLGRLIPGLSRRTKGTPRLSVFAEARDQTQSIVPWFFVHG